MAFQQPRMRPQPLRQHSLNQQSNELQLQQQTPASPLRRKSIEASQEWILFAPPGSDEDLRTLTSQTARTATHLTDSISLETHAPSQPLGSGDDALEADRPGVVDDDGDDDGAEMDSLDDGLHAFHHHPFSVSSAPRLDVSGGTLLPTHDGLGTFTSSAGLQDQLWQFERYNPQRRRQLPRRKSSIQRRIDEIEKEEPDLTLEEERTARIEKWRLEQSRAVLEEIERETRRRQRRQSRMSAGVELQRQSTNLESLAEQPAPLRGQSVAARDSDTPSVHQPSQEAPQAESFWRRITRRVIQDLIGLDDNTLSVIFGERLMDDHDHDPDPSPTPTQPSPIARQAARESGVAFRDTGHTWEVKLLERIARELGVLVHQIGEHDGAFHTYMRAISEEPEYAGIPVDRTERPLRQHRPTAAPSDSLFAPTLPQGPLSPTEAPDTSLWGIEEEDSAQTTAAAVEAARLRLEQEYWERSIDVKMIFSYLWRVFSSASPSRGSSSAAAEPALSSTFGPLPASWATADTSRSAATATATALGTSPESVRRAEFIRRQHPLVSRAADRAAQLNRRRESMLRRHHMQTLLQKRAGSSSCASQSTTNKRSRRSRSGSLVSSRNYWDLGGSVGDVSSGKAMNSAALGGWGKV